jgi:hypothetical protein
MNIPILNYLTWNLNQKSIWKNINTIEQYRAINRPKASQHHRAGGPWTGPARRGASAPQRSHRASATRSGAAGDSTQVALTRWGLRIGHQCREAIMPSKVTVAGAHQRSGATWRRRLDPARWRRSSDRRRQLLARRKIRAVRVRETESNRGKEGRMAAHRWPRVEKRWGSGEKNGPERGGPYSEGGRVGLEGVIPGTRGTERREQAGDSGMAAWRRDEPPRSIGEWGADQWAHLCYSADLYFLNIFQIALYWSHPKATFPCTKFLK